LLRERFRSLPLLPGPAGGSDERLSFAAAALFALLFHLVWQGHGIFDPAFRNPDVAGIVYNARLFGSGHLPYLDSAEIKPPGAFLLFAPLLDLGGMRAVWAAAVVWGFALSLATGLLAASVWEPRAGPRATVLHAACAAIASDADINYSFWMATPFTLAAACACAGAAVGNVRRRALLFGASGFLAMLAVSIKPSAWPLLAVFGVLVGRALFARDFRAAWQASAAGVGGACLALLALASPYLLRGELAALLRGLGAVETFGHEYVAAVSTASGGRIRAILGGLPCVAEQMPGPLVLGLLGAAELFPRGRRTGRMPIAAWTFAGAALVGLSYTLRFFSHDNAQLWPALAVIAVRPAGMLGRLLDFGRSWPITLPATAALGLVAAWPGFEYRWGYVHWMAERDHMVTEICDTLEPQLGSNDPVLAWGWNAWSVYEHCHRRAPGRVFKVIASVTTVNTNTCNNGFGPMQLRAGPEPRRFLDEVKHRPPGLFLWSNYFKEMGGDPLDGWVAFREFLDERYAIVDVRGPFVAFLRSDLVPGHRTAGAEGPPQPDSPSRPAAGSGLYGWSGRAGSVWTSTSRTPENPALMASITQCVTR
jgi:hypothetical protein